MRHPHSTTHGLEFTHIACVSVGMASLQIRDMPDDLYQALAERAARQRRSLAQQAVADLSLIEEFEARRRRAATIEELRKRPARRKLSDAVRIVRGDRER